MIKISIEAALIGYYKSRKSPNGADITLSEFIQGIRSGQEWKKHVLWVREAIDDKNEYDRRKGTSACVTIGGTFDGEKKAENLRLPSGLLAADLDHLDDLTESVKYQLSQDPFVVAVFKSIGGRGLCVIFRIDSSRFLDSFKGIASYLMEKHGLVGKQFDPSSSNINRLRYISYDPEAYYNPSARLFAKYPRKEAKAEKPFRKYIESKDNIEYILDQINARAIDIAPGYQEWYKVGWALISHYGDDARNIFQQISQFNENYDPDEVDKKFDYLMATRPARITIATFYFHCKQANIDIFTPETKEVSSLVAMSKKNKVSLESAIDTVVKMSDHQAEFVRPIAEQVYACPEDFDIDESLFDQLELFLNMNYQLKFNEITHYIESSGTPLLDKDLNTVYIKCAKAFDMKVSKDNVLTLLMSDFVPSVNPVKAFFNAHKNRKKPMGVIDALADTIETDMPKDYVHFFIRKFLVGMVGTVYGLQCPLVPILTGGQNLGKTQFWRRLLPDELQPYYAESKFAKDSDDEVLMCKRILLMNDDFDNEFLAKHSKFKGLTDKFIFTVRKPYGKAHEDLKRLALIAGTSNEKNLLSDPTGNRRIIPINVLKINFAAYNAIDKIDLLMEAFWCYDNGETGDLTHEQVAFLNKHTTGFLDVTVERDIVEKYFSVPTIKEDAVLMSQGEILAYLQQMSGLKNLKPKTISQEMKLLGFPYSDGEYYKPEAKSKRGFWLYKRTINENN